MGSRAMGNDTICLENRGAQLAIIEYDQGLARLHVLSLDDGHARHNRCDLAADVDAKRRLDMPTCDNRYVCRPRAVGNKYPGSNWLHDHASFFDKHWLRRLFRCLAVAMVAVPFQPGSCG